jgi:hypothetical protein
LVWSPASYSSARAGDQLAKHEDCGNDDGK